MKQILTHVTQKWRDILLVATAVLILSTILLVVYSVNQNNTSLAREQKLQQQNTMLEAQSKALAEDNQKHIDCIVKDLATPIPSDAKSRVITSPFSDCDIKFTQ